jgi:hypothetical protein
MVASRRPPAWPIEKDFFNVPLSTNTLSCCGVGLPVSAWDLSDVARGEGETLLSV